jgi:hypothetical protein
MTIEQMVEAWLTANGYDGLAGDDCGCFVGDLMPCGLDVGGCTRCVAGHAETRLEDGREWRWCAPGKGAQ